MSQFVLHETAIGIVEVGDCERPKVSFQQPVATLALRKKARATFAQLCAAAGHGRAVWVACKLRHLQLLLAHVQDGVMAMVHRVGQGDAQHQ